MSEDETSNSTRIVVIDKFRGRVRVTNQRTGEQKDFEFDLVYDTVSQEQIYTDTTYSIVESVIEGYNGNICLWANRRWKDFQPWKEGTNKKNSWGLFLELSAR